MGGECGGLPADSEGALSRGEGEDRAEKHALAVLEFPRVLERIASHASSLRLLKSSANSVSKACSLEEALVRLAAPVRIRWISSASTSLRIASIRLAL